MFKNIRRDYQANGRSLGHLGFWALLVSRFGRWRYAVRPSPVRKVLSMLYRVAFKLVQIATGIEHMAVGISAVVRPRRREDV